MPLCEFSSVKDGDGDLNPIHWDDDIIGKVGSMQPETNSVTMALSATTNGTKIFGRAGATAQLA